MSALDGKVALVAGASTGIGLATALAFADAGARVHAAARRPELIEEGAGAPRDRPRARRQRPRRGRPSSRATIRSLHVVVVAAGVNIKKRRFDETSDEDWDRVLATNLTGAFNVHAGVPAGAARGARRRGPDRQRLGQPHRPLRRRLPGVQGRPARARARRGFRRGRRGALHHRRARRGRHADPREPPGASGRRHAQADAMPEDVAAACLFAVSLPPRAYVPELTILPTALQALGRTT